MLNTSKRWPSLTPISWLGSQKPYLRTRVTQVAVEMNFHSASFEALPFKRLSTLCSFIFGAHNQLPMCLIGNVRVFNFILRFFGCASLNVAKRWASIWNKLFLIAFCFGLCCLCKRASLLQCDSGQSHKKLILFSMQWIGRRGQTKER